MRTFELAAVDGILALVALEAVVLVAVRRRGGRAPGSAQTLTFLGAGAALLTAVRAVLADWPIWAVLGALLAAGVAHAAHLALDARSPGRP